VIAAMKSYCTLVLLFVCICPVLAETTRQLSDREITQKLAEFDRTMDDFVRGNPRQKAIDTINELIATHNRWIEARNGLMDTEKARVDGSAESMDGLRTQVEAADRILKQTLQPGTSDEADNYNRSVEERNALVAEYNTLGDQHRLLVEQFNDRAAEFQLEIESRGEAVKAAKEEHERRIDGIDAWSKDKRDESFFLELNRLYAAVTEMDRASGTRSRSAGNTLRSLRSELGEHARATQDESEYGLLVVPVTINGKETIYMLLDTGASRMTITPEVVRVLNLTTGDAIEMNVAGGLTVAGPEAVLAEVSLYGATALDIPAAVIPNSDLGVDGLLGRSFLKRFILHIDDSKSPSVELTPR
tara:strand:- start:35 stop:1111 length:1077 start_codon:yes stop_codon:yes gene_type:complete